MEANRPLASKALALALFLGSLVPIVSLMERIARPVDSFAFVEYSHSHFQNLGNLIYNSVISWRMSESLSKLLPHPEAPYPDYPIILIVLFSFGVFFHYLRRAGSEENIVSMISLCALLPLSLFAWIGLDVVLWSAITFLPFLIYFLHRCKETKGALRFIFASIFCIMKIAHDVPQLAPMVILLTFAFVLTDTEWILSKPRKLLLAIGTALPVIWASWNVSHFEKLHYPRGAFITPSYSTLGSFEPLVAERVSPQSMNALNLEAISLLACLIVACLLLPLWLRKNHRALLRHQLLCVSLLGLVILDGALRLFHNGVLISPLSTLSRLLPGLAGYSMTPLIFLIAITFLTLGDLRERKAPGTSFLILPLILLLSFLPQSAEVRGFSFEKSKILELQSEGIPVSLISRSPSASYLHDQDLAPAFRTKNLHILPGKQFVKEIHTSSPTKSSKPILTKKTSDRWSPQTGNQTGQEWLMVEFQRPIRVALVEVSPGNFSTDYPRGIRVSGRLRCPEKHPSGVFTTLYERNPWQGKIAFSKQGLPFRKHESIVRIPLESPRKVGCLLIEQIGKTERFDWSVSHIQIGIPRHTDPKINP